MSIFSAIIESQCFFLECPKSTHGKNAKLTFFVIKGALISWCSRRLVSLCEIVSINFQEHFRIRNSIILVFLVLPIEKLSQIKLFLTLSMLQYSQIPEILKTAARSTFGRNIPWKISIFSEQKMILKNALSF